MPVPAIFFVLELRPQDVRTLPTKLRYLVDRLIEEELHDDILEVNPTIAVAVLHPAVSIETMSFINLCPL